MVIPWGRLKRAAGPTPSTNPLDPLVPAKVLTVALAEVKLSDLPCVAPPMRRQKVSETSVDAALLPVLFTALTV